MENDDIILLDSADGEIKAKVYEHMAVNGINYYLLNIISDEDIDAEDEEFIIVKDTSNEESEEACFEELCEEEFEDISKLFIKKAKEEGIDFTV